MSRDVIITPLSGLIDFQNAANSRAQIALGVDNNLVISNPGGDLSLGDTATNVFIGDGINQIDIVFEQNGAVRAEPGKTLTLGAAGSSLSLAANITSGANITGNVTAGNVAGTLGAFTTVTGNGRALTSLTATNIDTGTVPSARLSGTYTITVSGSATTAGTVTTAAQPNITSVGTLSSLSVVGNVTGNTIIATGNVEIENRGVLLLYETNNSNYIGLRSPSTLTDNFLYTFPTNYGNLGQVLTTNGAGTLTWENAGEGSGAISFPNSTVRPVPGSDGNFDLSFNFVQTVQETPFSSTSTDAFGVNLGEVYSMMDPVGEVLAPVDLGALT